MSESPRVVDYDQVAPFYDRRYERSHYSGVAKALVEFIGDGQPATLEVGCGTGHWLEAVREHVSIVVGVDLSRGMLERARRSGGTRLVAARAESLPLESASFDRIFCVNAFHHFSDKPTFIREARRVLRPKGGLFTVGVDPHTGLDQWWIYDYFEQALEIDKGRYPPTQEIRSLMREAGFHHSETAEAQHNPRVLPASTAHEIGIFEKTSTSQLIVLSDEEFKAGMDRIRRDEEVEKEKGKELLLTSDLRLYATTGWVA